MRKRTAVAVLAVLSALGLSPANPAGAVAGFGDLDSGRYYTAAVQWMVDEAITTGTSPACFSPDGLVTRGQAAAFLHRWRGEPAAPPSPFTDVTRDWQVPAVAWLFAEGSTTGTSPTTYAPEAQVTRGEVAALLHRLAGEPTATGHPFVDISASWQDDAVAWMFEEGITTGTSVSTFSPDLPVTRAQFATFLHRDAGQPSVMIDPDSPTCEDATGRRQVIQTGYGVFATVGALEARFPAAQVERIGFHQSGHDGSQEYVSTATDVATTTLSSRSRGTALRSAADIVVDPDAEIRAPVSGTVIRAGGYTLYCEYRDEFVVINPDDRPGWEVKVFHFEGLSVGVGDEVTAGVTVIGTNATILPFVSQIDEFTASPSWPHVHVEVIDPSIPDRPSPNGGC